MDETLKQIVSTGKDSSISKKPGKVDKFLLVVTIALILFGLLIFSSASLGLIARSTDGPSDVIFSQLVLGLGAGLIGAFFAYKIPYTYFRRASFWILIASIIVSMLVFTSLGFEFGGARRWLSLGPISFQPAEFLKFGFILFFSSWLATIKDDIKSIKYGVLPIVIILIIVALPLLLQPDHGTFLALFASGIAMIIVAGMKWKHLFVLVISAAIILLVIAFFKPYMMERLTTFINPNYDPLGSSYQLRQSLIAVGSGGIFGNGLGQSVQKFSYLPEPVGDSIFAVYAEEFGFIGSVILIFIFVLLFWRGMRLAKKSGDRFISIVIVGFMVLIIGQSFLNIGAMIGIFPLTGVPLIFVSHGGTAFMFSLIEIGFVLQLTRYIKS